MAYALDNLTNGSDYVSLLSFVNETTGYWFGNLVLIAVFSLIFISMKTGFNYDPKSVLSASTFITTVLSIILRLMGLVPDATMYICILGATLAAVSLIWN